MLQIATGKLFTHPTALVNQLRGTLYTNAIFPREDRDGAVETVAGRLLPSSSYSIRPSALVYEISEHIEEVKNGPLVLISSGIEPYLHDYSVVASFALNCVCTADIDLARRLTTGQRGLATRVAPHALVRRFFDQEIWCGPDDIEFLEHFIEKLIGLPRKTYICVMRSIRTYVTGMHRIADDLELAYTLLVASVESLAQDFDGHKNDWESLDQRKRKAIDDALQGADETVANRVRDALLEVEHTALARRFREFSIAHTTPAYFRQPSESASDSRLGRSAVAEVLAGAYQLRSKYVHQLQRLPDALTLEHVLGETAIEGRTMHLTLQGLTRLMRSVIIEFLMRQPTVPREPYDYNLERSGVVRVRLAPQYWVGNTDGDITRAGRNKLEGFLQQLASILLGEPNATLTDLRPVLAAACAFVPTIRKELRRPYLALHLLFHLAAPRPVAVEIPPEIGSLIDSELTEPSSEALISFTLAGKTVDWPLEVHNTALNTYFGRRASTNGLRLPRVFEAAISLDLSERFRTAGEFSECQRVFGLAVENFPGNARLLEAEKNLLPTRAILWRQIMLPSPKQPEQRDT